MNALLTDPLLSLNEVLEISSEFVGVEDLLKSAKSDQKFKLKKKK